MKAIENGGHTLDKALKNKEMVITAFTKSDRETFLLREMGLTVGRKVKISFKSPIGSPFCVEYSGYRLLIGKETAKKIIVKALEGEK